MVRPRAMLLAAGHVGLWPGLYVASAYVCFWQLAGAGDPGAWPDLRMLVAVLMASVGVYAFDRVKLTSARIDPADIRAQPARYEFLIRHARRVRLVAITLIVLAMVVAEFASVLMPVAIATSLLGVIVYAPGPRGTRPRLKDVMGVKNLYVAAGVVGLAALATLLIGPLSRVHGDAFWRLLPARLDAVTVAGVLLLARVTIDAMLCDIDDAASDAAHGTQTLPNVLGANRAFRVGIALRIALACTIPLLARAPTWVGLAWGCAGAAGVLPLIATRRRSLRDAVDVEFALEAVAVLIVSLVVRSGHTLVA